MKRLILVSAVVLSFASFGVPEQASAACSGDLTSLYSSGTKWYASGWANCSGKLCLTTASGTSCDYSSPFSVSRSAGVCVSGQASYVSAYVTSGGNVVDAASVRTC